MDKCEFLSVIEDEDDVDSRADQGCSISSEEEFQAALLWLWYAAISQEAVSKIWGRQLRLDRATQVRN